jgi:hypothetical protein
MALYITLSPFPEMPYKRYRTSKYGTAPPKILAVGGVALFALVLAFLWPEQDLYRMRTPLPAIALAPAPAVAAVAVAKPLNPVFRNSVIPGGVRSAVELASAVQRDPVVMAHYADFNVAAARLLRLEQSRLVHVSYRIGDKIYWTKKKVRLAMGESLLSDGKHLTRTRCGNRIADEPEGPVLDNEPAPEVLDAVFVSAEDLIDQAVNMAAVNSAPAPATATAAVAVAATVARPLGERDASGMRSVAPDPTILFPNLWNVRNPVSLVPALRVDALAFAPPVVERSEANVLGVVVSVRQPELAIIAEPEGEEPGSPVTTDSKTPQTPNTPEQDPSVPFTPPPEFGPQVLTPIAATPAPTPTPVPEPGSAALVGLALIALTLVRRGTGK